MFRDDYGRFRVMDYPQFDGTQPCMDEDMNVFFPEGTGQVNDYSYNRAREVCSPCSYQYECAMWAIHHDNGYGFFGGMTPNDRRAFRSRAGIRVQPIKVQSYISSGARDET